MIGQSMRCAIEVWQHKVGRLKIVECSLAKVSGRADGGDPRSRVDDGRPVEQFGYSHGIDFAVALDR